jgi:hypothetical protein
VGPGGLLTYHASGFALPETELDDTLETSGNLRGGVKLFLTTHYCPVK